MQQADSPVGQSRVTFSSMHAVNIKRLLARPHIKPAFATGYFKLIRTACSLGSPALNPLRPHLQQINSDCWIPMLVLPHSVMRYRSENRVCGGEMERGEP